MGWRLKSTRSGCLALLGFLLVGSSVWGCFTCSGDFTDTRSYSYAPYSQRLTQESFNVSGSLRFTNNYTFDNGQAGGLGVLTSIGTPAQSTNTWSAPASGGLDNLGRVAKEQTAILRRPATGLALGAATVSATLDGGPVNVQFDGTGAEGRWRAMVDMTPGSHTLRLAAEHPSGQYTAYATNTFNVTGGADTVSDAFDGNGNVSQRVWLGSNGQTNRTQTMTWDAFDRLIKVSERDSVGSGQDWVAVFDGLGRKVRTITTLVVSNTPITTPADAVSTVDLWFDPQVEFQEVGVVVNGGVFNMKTYGPDANGVHGGLQGVGGLERVTPFGHISGIGLLQDYFGNIVGSVTNALYGVAWNPARFSSIGPVPGYQPPALTLNANLAQSVGWRGKHIETFGAFYWGARPYLDGRFLRHDSLFDMANPDGFGTCGGDLVNHFDADARFGKGFSEGLATYANQTQNGVLGFMADVGIISPLTASHYSQETHDVGYYVCPSAAYEAGVNAGYSAVPSAVILATVLMMPGLGEGEAGALEAEAGMARGEVGALEGFASGGEQSLAAEASVMKTDFGAEQSELNLSGQQSARSYLPYGQGVSSQPLDQSLGMGSVSLREQTQLEFSFGNAQTTANSTVGRILSRLDQYPQVIDPRTGRYIPFPSQVGAMVPQAQRVSWGAAERGNYIADWYQRGYAAPTGGWENYDIHHILPREFGGGNDFWNLVPVERQTHQNLFNSFWQNFNGL